MRVYAFEGTLYRPDDDGPPDLGAPPFDQIDASESRRLHAKDPRHFSHLTRPDAGEGDPHRAAARLHARWLAEGVAARDPDPALYPYVIDLAGGGHRSGLCCLVGLEPAEAGVIRPHERTVEKTIEERLGLLRATRVDLEPILLLADDDGAIDRWLPEDVEGMAPVADHRDRYGHRHRLFRLADPERIELYRDALADRTALIADGHHRYRTASTYAREIGAAPGSAAGAKLAVLTSLESPGLTIDPIHRGWERAASVPERPAGVLERVAWEGDGGSELAAAVAAEDGPAVAIWVVGGRPEIWRLDPSAAPADLPRAAGELPVVLLHHAVQTAIGLGDASVTYRSDPDALWGQMASGELHAAAWLPPMEPATFAAAVAEGDLLPAKSTRFLPKLTSGLVWVEHTARVA